MHIGELKMERVDKNKWRNYAIYLINNKFLENHYLPSRLPSQAKKKQYLSKLNVIGEFSEN